MKRKHWRGEPYLHLRNRGSRTVHVAWGHSYWQPESESAYRRIFESFNVNARIRELWDTHQPHLSRTSWLVTAVDCGSWSRCPHGLAQKVASIIGHAHREIVATVSGAL